MTRTDNVNLIIEGLRQNIAEKEDFVVDHNLSDVYMVSLDWSPKTRPKSFKDYDKAEDYAIRSLKSSLNKKTVVPSQYKRVTIAKGNQIIKVLSAKDL